MKSILLDVKNNEVKLVDPKGLSDYYKLIGCDLIDIVSRKIGRKRFDIVCDDEALLRDGQPKISAIDNFGGVMLVGNLIICGSPDSEGELTDLTRADINYVLNRILTLSTHKYPEGYSMLTQCEY